MAITAHALLPRHASLSKHTCLPPGIQAAGAAVAQRRAEWACLQQQQTEWLCRLFRAQQQRCSRTLQSGRVCKPMWPSIAARPVSVLGPGFGQEDLYTR